MQEMMCYTDIRSQRGMVQLLKNNQVFFEN